MKLIMLPYAGSFFNAYREWEMFTSPELKIVSIDYCGRGKNAYLEQPKSWRELIVTTCDLIRKQISGEEAYALFGHSMGAKVAYSAYAQLKAANDKLPETVIFSGTKAFDAVSEDVTSLSEQEFENYFIELGGIDEEVLQHSELRKMIFEYLWEDMNLVKEFDFKSERVEITCPVIVLNGKEDKKSTEKRWAHALGKQCSYLIFAGSHFFLFQNKAVVYSKLRNELMNVRKRKVG